MILALVYLWPLLLIAVVAFVIIRMLVRRHRKNHPLPPKGNRPAPAQYTAPAPTQSEEDSSKPKYL